MIEWLLKVFQKQKYQKVIEENNNYLNHLKESIKTEQRMLEDLKNKKDNFKNNLKDEWLKENEPLIRERGSLLKEIELLTKSLDSERNRSSFEEIGFSEKPVVNTTISYEEKLKTNKEKQKEMIKKQEAGYIVRSITFNNSEKEGAKLQKENIKFLLRTFNTESDEIIRKLRYTNLDISINKLNKSFESINKLNERNLIALSEDYLKLKIEEVHLVYHLHKAKELEKELAKELREEEREKKKLEQEIKAKEQELAKQRKLALKNKSNIEKQLELDTQNEQLLMELKKLQDSLDLMDKKEEELKNYKEKGRSGYVYIISNKGAFGENVYKIGMTRRLEPEERIKELSGASVPFVFDVHAMILTDDAPGLESKFHNKFSKYRVNRVNNRKEFFELSFDELKQAVLDFEPNALIIEDVDAFEYYESLIMKNNQHE